MHLATTEQIKYFKERWNKILIEDLEQLDQLLIPSLILIGKHPDMAPVWSCQGHPDRKSKKSFAGYIMIATDNRVIIDDILERLFLDTLNNESLKNYAHLWRIGSTFRNFQFRDTVDADGGWWKANVISWGIPSSTEPSAWVEVLENALKTVLISE